MGIWKLGVAEDTCNLSNLSAEGQSRVHSWTPTSQSSLLSKLQATKKSCPVLFCKDYFLIICMGILPSYL